MIEWISDDGNFLPKEFVFYQSLSVINISTLQIGPWPKQKSPILKYIFVYFKDLPSISITHSQI